MNPTKRKKKNKFVPCLLNGSAWLSASNVFAQVGHGVAQLVLEDYNEVSTYCHQPATAYVYISDANPYSMSKLSLPLLYMLGR